MSGETSKERKVVRTGGRYLAVERYSVAGHRVVEPDKVEQCNLAAVVDKEQVAVALA